MTNSYEMSEVLERGKASEKMLGSKPRLHEVDSILGTEWSLWILPDDIDESDD